MSRTICVNYYLIHQEAAATSTRNNGPYRQKLFVSTFSHSKSYSSDSEGGFQLVDKSGVKSWALPFFVAVYVEGAFDNRGPLQAADDKRVGPGPLRLHQLAFYRSHP